MTQKIPPVPPEENADYRNLRTEIQKLHYLVNCSFAGMNNWRDKDSYTRRLEIAEKRSAALYEQLVAKYKKKRAEYDQYIREEQEKEQQRLKEEQERIKEENRKIEKNKKKGKSAIGFIEV